MSECITVVSGCDVEIIDTGCGTTTIVNVGTGEGTIYRDTTSDINLKTIKAGSGVIITNNADDITIDATGAGGGESNTSSNSGSGSGLALPKNGVDLPFKTIIGGSNITLTEQADTVTVNSTASGSTNLDYTPAATQGTVTSDTGTDAVLPAVGANAGLILPADKTKIDSLDATYEPIRGANDNYVTDAEKVVIGNTSGANSGDQTDMSLITDTIVNFNLSISDATLIGDNTGDQDLSSYAPLASPGLTGTPTSPTPANNSTPAAIATTQYVEDHTGTGEENTSSNSGAGAGIALPKSGVDLPFKSLIGGSSIDITQEADTITINSTASASGEANTASSKGGGIELTLVKDFVDLPFKTLAAGTNVTIDDALDVITINSSASGGATNLGYTPAVNQGTVTSDTGTDAVIPEAGVNAGLLIPADKTKLNDLATTYEPIKSADDNYVTDAEKIVIGNTSGTNTGDQDLSTYAPLASPALTGAPTAPTPADNTTPTALATTQYVADNSGGGVTDHDALNNLLVANQHNIGVITGLQTALDAKKDDFSENTGFNKNFGVIADTVSQGNHNHDGDYDSIGSAATVQSNLDTHEADTLNPHGVTAAQTGAVDSNTTETGSVQIFNMVSMTQTAYDALTPIATTLYIISG